MRNHTESEHVPFADDIPTRVEKVIITKREYERLKHIVREGETSRIKSRNRIIAVFAMVLMFGMAGVYMYVC